MTAIQHSNDTFPQILTKPLIIMTLTVIAIYIFSGIGVLVYLTLAVYSLRGVKEAVQALCILFMLNLINHGIMPPFGGQSMIRWLVFFAACGRIIWERQFHQIRNTELTIPLFVFSFVVLLFSILFSYVPSISISKIIMFSVGVYSILTAFSITSSMKDYWESWFFTFMAFIVFVSVPLYFSGLGYFRHGPAHGFQGILYHSQSFGAFLAPVAAWTTLLLFREGKKPLAVIAVCLLSWFFLFATGTRTAFLAAVLGIGIILLIDMVKGSDKSILVRWLFSHPVRIALVSLIVVGVTVNFTFIQGFIGDFTAKYHEVESYYGEYQRSRGFLIEASMENFRDHPVTGIGFGIDSNYENVRVEQDAFFGIPIAATIEKGFLLSAALEELGIAGFAVFLFLLFAIIRYVFIGNDLALLAVFLASLFLNIGEMIIFSFGGLGLYSWLLVGFATLSTHHTRSVEEGNA